MPEDKNTNSRKKRNKNENKKDFYVRIMIVQILVVALLSGGLFTFKKLSPDKFELLRQSYIQIMKKDISAKDVFSKIKNYNFSQQGGDDISVFSPQTGTSFSPYYISSEICTPVSGKISSKFGYRINPVTKSFAFHSGIDIGAESGEKIKAAYYGKVSKVDYDDISGNYVILTHSDGLVTKYLHCSEIIVEEGMVVRSGETIALVGSTGRSTGPHLHFTVEINGKKVDPLYVLDSYDNKV